MSCKIKKPFTLLEVVVAVAIFATVIMVASMGLLTVQQTWRKAHKHGRQLEALLKIDRVLDTSFRNIIPMYWVDEDTKKQRPIFTGSEDKVTFATIHRITKTNFSAIRFMTLSVENGDLIASYRKSPIFTWDADDTGLIKEVLAKDVESISFLYADENSTGKIEFTKEWQYDEVAHSKHHDMPLGIQLKIIWKDATERVWFRRTAGSGKYENLDKIKRFSK